MIYINLLHVRRRPLTCELCLGAVGMPGCRYRLAHHKPLTCWSVGLSCHRHRSSLGSIGCGYHRTPAPPHLWSHPWGLPGTEAIVLIASSGGAEAEPSGGRKNLLRGFGSGVGARACLASSSRSLASSTLTCVRTTSANSFFRVEISWLLKCSVCPTAEEREARRYVPRDERRDDKRAASAAAASLALVELASSVWRVGMGMQ